MGKFDVTAMRYLQPEHFRILLAIEMGMKNHELVPLPLISSIAAIHRGAAFRILNELSKNLLVVYERGKRYDGYRLTTLGYDFLALKALNCRQTVGSVGNKIGVGKESDIYVGGDPNLDDLVLKFHRLGRTSFRKIKEKRDYHQRRHFCSWLYLSRIAALKEYSFLKALYIKKFPVPEPLDVCRHIVVMKLIDGVTLCHVNSIIDPEKLFDKLMKIIVRLANYGLIHGDFNEFNIMLTQDEEPIIIDFPQMISIDHPNAKFFFDRDVKCIRTFFCRKFNFDSLEWPEFDEIERRHNLDIEVAASGFTKKMAQDLNKAYDEGKYNVHLDDENIENKEMFKNLIEEDSTDVENISNKSSVNTTNNNNFQNQKILDENNSNVNFCQNVKNNLTDKQNFKKETRFDKWLKNTQAELEKMVLTEIEDLNYNDVDQKDFLNYTKIYEQTESTKENDKKFINYNNEEIIKNNEDFSIKKENKNFLKVKALHSVYSNGSTIVPEEIKKKLLKEKNKIKKERLKSKGKQNAISRGRRDNIYTIKEHKEWNCY